MFHLTAGVAFVVLACSQPGPDVLVVDLLAVPLAASARAWMEMVEADNSGVVQQEKPEVEVLPSCCYCCCACWHFYCLGCPMLEPSVLEVT